MEKDRAYNIARRVYEKYVVGQHDEVWFEKTYGPHIKALAAEIREYGKNLNNVLKYRDKEYFSKDGIYLFDNITSIFQSCVHFEKGYWWTDQKEIKCTSIKSVKIK